MCLSHTLTLCVWRSCACQPRWDWDGRGGSSSPSVGLLRVLTPAFNHTHTSVPTSPHLSHPAPNETDRDPSSCLLGQFLLPRRGERGFLQPPHSALSCTVEVTLTGSFTANTNGSHGRQHSTPADGCL